MGAAIISRVFRKRIPPALRPALHPRAAAASAAVASAMQVAALDTGMCTESDASLDIQVLPLLSHARAVLRRYLQGLSVGVALCLAPCRSI
eukprot:8303568-Pyramimonas_sp.AAC.1